MRRQYKSLEPTYILAVFDTTTNVITLNIAATEDANLIIIID